MGSESHRWRVYATEDHLKRLVSIRVLLNLKRFENNTDQSFTEGCAVTIEAAGPQAYYEVDRIKPSFTVSSSPFQLRGLASYIVRSCVSRSSFRGEDASIGGFATDKIANLANFVQAPSTDLNGEYRMTTSSLCKRGFQ